MKELWKPVEDWPYMISNFGQIKSVNTFMKKNNGRIMKGWITLGGYKVVQLCNTTKKRRVTTISRLVALAFIANPFQKSEVNHKDGNKLNNFYLNLEWVTPSENIIHAYRKGLMSAPKGEDCRLAKLTWLQVEEIRRIYKENPHITYCGLGEIFGVKGNAIKKIIRRITWK